MIDPGDAGAVRVLYTAAMFRFFRRARQTALSEGNSMKFFRYAVGEILLVVIGILIALQINNWNEERIEKNEIRQYALNLADAIDRDMEMLLPVEIQIRASIRESEEMAGYLRGRSLEDISNAELFFMSTIVGYRPYGWNRAALEQIKASGGLRKMKNQRLVQLISDYDALTLHLDQDYQEDQEAAQAIADLSHELLNLNYPPQGLREQLEWEDGLTMEDIEWRFSDFRETELFKKLAALGWPLLSQDLSEFRRLANLSRDYAEGTWPRPDIELPRLREFADEIQDLIKEEYR